MESRSVLSGKMGKGDNPDWTALEELVRNELLGWFMWMFEVNLEDGARVHAYKHKLTRRYVHVAEDGRVFYYVSKGRYHQTDPFTALMSALDGWEAYSTDESEGGVDGDAWDSDDAFPMP